jgi:hypothetical protein
MGEGVGAFRGWGRGGEDPHPNPPPESQQRGKKRGQWLHAIAPAFWGVIWRVLVSVAVSRY